jgi:serine protease Do
MTMRKSFTLAGAGLAVLLLLPVPGFAQTREAFQKNAPRILEAFGDVVARPSDSVARVLCDDKEVALATVVGADGWLVTKASELIGTSPVIKLADGKEYKGKIVGIHKPYDLALIQIPAQKLPVIEWSKETALPGEWLATPGPGKTELPLAIGVVSVAARKVGPRDMPGFTPPASGGFLGVTLADGEGGVLIETVSSGNAAAKAGLKAKDLVLAINGKQVKDVESMIVAVSGHKPGETITIKIKREGEEKEMKATLDRRPGIPGRPDQNLLGSSLSRRKNGFPTILQHDTVVKPEDCGGPVVNLDGLAVGINIARAGRVESYAVPAEAVLTLLPDLKAGKFPPPPEGPKPETIKEAPVEKKK